MGLKLDHDEGQTRLDDDEKDGLLISTVSTRSELNEFEQLNIEKAIQWTIGRTLKPDTIFSEDFVKGLHKRMFSDVWAWAGDFRKTNKNMGVDKWQIPTDLRNLLHDVKYWIDKNTYPPDETAIRFKHRVVSIHCFANGNGRHSRLMADVIIDKVFGLPVFSWGAITDVKTGDSRKEYINALKAADIGNIESLIKFARS